MRILVTGGTGFIGSHTVVELLQNGHDVFIVDNLINSNKHVLDAINTITGTKPNFRQLDVRETDTLTDLLIQQHIDAVIHFAALKAVGESVDSPLLYYQNNISGLLSVIDAMQKSGVKNLIFSSSATVYGNPDSLPINESAPFKPPTNPYGASKQMAEQIIGDVAKTRTLKAINLRYFNPIGAHPSGLIGELPMGAPNNLVPYVTQVAAGIRDELTVFGDDYDTPDGSGIRDYIHVVDLAKAHMKAVYHLDKMNDQVLALNIGTGKGASVFEILHTFEKISKVNVPYVVGPRRAGDIAACYANPSKANKLLNWKAELSLEDALRDAWRWQRNYTF